MKLANGDIACLTSRMRVVRMDATGKEINSIPIQLGQLVFGGRIHMLPTGRVLVPQHMEHKVVEYDTTGKVIWEAKVQQPIAAWRLPNGNTLVTSMSEQRAIELDRDGHEVWTYRGDKTRVTRAYRR
jgi:hypothetical protein